MIPVWLVRDVRMAPFGGLFRRGVLLPFVPRAGEASAGSIGTGIILKYDQDPYEVEQVYVNSAGAVVVWMRGVEEGSYGNLGGDDETEGQFEYETEGWERCDTPRPDAWEPPVDPKPYRATGWPDKSEE